MPNSLSISKLAVPPVADASSPVPNAPLPREAWDALADARAALPQNELIPVNVDVQSAAILALGAYDEIVAIRADAVAALPHFDPTTIDRLPAYASAAYHGQTIFQTTDADVQMLPALNEEAMALREMLYADLTPLVKRGLVPAGTMKDYKGTFGYRIVSADLAMLASTLRTFAEVARGKTTVTESDLERAERLGQRILLAVGRREQGQAGTSFAVLERQRAFTLFARIYDEVRRAVSYLRWHEGDVERIAPSIYGGRTRGGKSEVEEDEADTAASSNASIGDISDGPFMSSESKHSPLISKIDGPFTS